MSNSFSHKVYEKYEFLAKKYAAKVYNYEELSYEYEDILQEFKIKIYTSIRSYGKRYSLYLKGEASKPVPLRYYIEGALRNKLCDFVKYIKKENHKVRIDDIDYDFGCEFDTEISPEKNRFILNGIDLLENLSGLDKVVFSLYLKGVSKKIINKVSSNNESIISFQKNYLLVKYGNELYESKQMFERYQIEE